MDSGAFPPLPFVWTRHARNRLRRTTLAQPELENLARSAAAIRRDGNRTNIWLEWNGWLRVVLVEEADAIVVISVIWPARAPKD
jgi:hypothetical protein